MADSFNRNPIKQWFITFPQTDTTKQLFLDSFPPYELGMVAQETHEDGGLHLHMLIVLKKALSKSKLLTYIQKRWPDDYKRINTQPTKSKADVIDYLNKEDSEVLVVSTKERKMPKWIAECYQAQARRKQENIDLNESILAKHREEHKQDYDFFSRGL